MKYLQLLTLIFVANYSFSQINDDFQTTGNLSSQNGWITNSGTVGQIQITADNLTYPGLTNSGNKVQISSSSSSEVVNKSTGASPYTGGTVYYSLLVNVLNTTGMSALGDYSICLSSGNGNTLPTPLVSRLYFKTGSSSNKFAIGINNNTGTVQYSAVELNTTTTYFIVVKFNFNNNSTSLFVNPAIGGFEPGSTNANATGISGTLTQINGFAFRNSNNTTGNIQFDSLRVGDSWTAVTGNNLSKDKFNNIAGLRVYPNPAKSELFITSNSFAEKQVQLFDVLGKKALSEKVTNQSLNISNIAKGIYVAKITEDGKTATRKIVIE